MAQVITTESVRNTVRIWTGAYHDDGTVAAYSFTTGFKPRYIRALNTDGLCIMEWIEGMADASAVKTVDSGSNQTDVTHVTSNGITVSDTGFTFGLDTDMNVSDEQVYLIAMG